MRRLNVQETQIDECIQMAMYAISSRPQTPELQPGEPLLLQLVKNDARHAGKLKSRINFALVFDHLERDHDGTISRFHWPRADKIWPWIVYCSGAVPTIPFSLEDLPLSRVYEGQTNPQYIEPQDEKLILPYIQGALAETPALDLQLIPTFQVPRKFGQKQALSAIYNHDRIAILRPVRKKIITKEDFDRNQALAEGLKAYYDCRCQVCGMNFEPKYGVTVADTHHIQYLAQGGRDVSGNIIVVCPNHHRVVHATDAHFNRQSLTYEYPNGLRERLILPDHFVEAPAFISQVL